MDKERQEAVATPRKAITWQYIVYLCLAALAMLSGFVLIGLSGSMLRATPDATQRVDWADGHEAEYALENATTLLILGIQCFSWGLDFCSGR